MKSLFTNKPWETKKWANNSRNFKTKNAKFSGYCFYMNTNIYGDF